MKRKLCDLCNETYVEKNLTAHFKSKNHIDNCLKNNNCGPVKIIKTAFKNRIITYLIENSTNVILPEKFVSFNKKKIRKLIKKALINKNGAIKINLEIDIRAEIPHKDEETVFNLSTGNIILTLGSNLNKYFKKIVDIFRSKSESFQTVSSGWSIIKPLHLVISINKAGYFDGGSQFIKLPKWLARKKCIVNIKNKNDS